MEDVSLFKGSVGVIFRNDFAFLQHLLFSDNLELITPENPSGQTKAQRSVSTVSKAATN